MRCSADRQRNVRVSRGVARRGDGARPSRAAGTAAPARTSLRWPSSSLSMPSAIRSAFFTSAAPLRVSAMFCLRRSSSLRVRVISSRSTELVADQGQARRRDVERERHLALRDVRVGGDQHQDREVDATQLERLADPLVEDLQARDRRLREVEPACAGMHRTGEVIGRRSSTRQRGAAAVVARDLRIRAERPRPRRRPAARARRVGAAGVAGAARAGDDAVRRLALLDPVDERREHVELVGRPGRREQWFMPGTR